MSSSLFLGIDIGSSFTKAVLLERADVIVGEVMPTGGDYRGASEKITAIVLEKAGFAQDMIAMTAATGYGSSAVPNAGKTYTDITCISRAVFELFPSARAAIDIGSQYSRVITLDGRGGNSGFLLTDRCAGGSGRLLQTMAHVLNVELEEIGPLSLAATDPVRFTTGCAVFAESEAISRIAEGAKPEDILAGVNNALAAVVANLVERAGTKQDIALVGGGANDTGLARSINRVLGTEVLVPDSPQLVTALGAALFASDYYADTNS